MEQEFESLIDLALAKATEANLDIYTFAFYHDHESGYVSICIDSELNSIEQVKSQNAYSMKHFKRLIQEGNLNRAVLWQANVGRNLSLGDFIAVNIVSYKLPEDSQPNESMYLAMINAINTKSETIQSLCSNSDKLLYCCSTSNEEVGLIWVPFNTKP